MKDNSFRVVFTSYDPLVVRVFKKMPLRTRGKLIENALSMYLRSREGKAFVKLFMAERKEKPSGKVEIDEFL